MTTEPVSPDDAAARVLYEAWRNYTSFGTLCASPWRILEDKHKQPWLAVAAKAKELYGEYQDDLVAEMDRVYAVVRENVSAVKWEELQRKFHVAEEGHREWDRHPYAFVDYDPEMRKAAAAAAGYRECDDDCTGEQHNRHYHPVDKPEIVGGPDFVGGFAAAAGYGPGWSEGKGPCERIAEAQGDQMAMVNERITALQREVCYQLNQLWTSVHSEGSRPTYQQARDRFNGIWDTFKEADRDVERKFGRAPTTSFPG